MATHAAGAAARPALLHPVQLTLQLCSIRAGRPHSSYWERVDLADVGGELQARNHAVRVLLAAQPDCGGTWTGYYDALFFSNTGVSGPTRPMPSRLDALSAAAHEVARQCRRLLNSPVARADRRAATEVMHWLEQLDLL
jgi:hypothetical protein